MDDQDLMICHAAMQLARAACGVVASTLLPSLSNLRRADLLIHDLSKLGTPCSSLFPDELEMRWHPSVPSVFDRLGHKNAILLLPGRELQCTFCHEYAAPIIISRSSIDCRKFV